jgi:hypothetical protein
VSDIKLDQTQTNRFRLAPKESPLPTFPVAGPLASTLFLGPVDGGIELQCAAERALDFESPLATGELYAVRLATSGYDDPELSATAYVHVEEEITAPAPAAHEPKRIEFHAVPPAANQMLPPLGALSSADVPLTAPKMAASTLRTRFVLGPNPNKKVAPPVAPAPQAAAPAKLAPSINAKPVQTTPVQQKTVQSIPVVTRPVQSVPMPARPAAASVGVQKPTVAPAPPAQPAMAARQASPAPSVTIKAPAPSAPAPQKPAPSTIPQHAPQQQTAAAAAASSPAPVAKVVEPPATPQKAAPVERTPEKSAPEKPATEKPKINVRPTQPVPTVKRPTTQPPPAAPSRPAMAARDRGNAVPVEREQPQAPPPPAAKSKVQPIRESYSPQTAHDVPMLGMPQADMSPVAAYWSNASVAVKGAIVALGAVAVVFVGSFIFHGSPATAGSAPGTSDQTSTSLPPPGSIIGGGGWSTNWGTEAPINKNKQISVYRPTMAMTDYIMTFKGQIEKKAMGWIFRAKDSKNYYVAKLEIVKPGLNPVVALVKYAVIDGKENTRTQVLLPMDAKLDTIWNMRIDVQGNKFITYAQDKLVDYWTDDQLKTGGAGFYNDKGEYAQINGINFYYQGPKK